MNAIYRHILILIISIVSSQIIGAERLPNIVFFLVDDLGWSDLGCYGSRFYDTPHVDEFVRDAVRFTEAYAACPVCSPTRASIMTGKYPATLQLTDWLPGRKDYPFQKLRNPAIHQHLPFAETTIAEALKDHGYATAIIGKWHLGEDPSGPLQHGFDVQIPRWNKGWPRAGYYAPFRMDGLMDAPGNYLTDCLTEVALQYIDENQDRPFFLYLSHFAVHDPIQGRANLVEKYRAKLTRNPSPQDRPFILEANPDAQEPLSRAVLDALLQDTVYHPFQILPNKVVKIKQYQDNVHFAAMIESMDDSFGRVLEKLKALGLDDKTIVIFFSDNGGMSAANFGHPDRVIPISQLDKAYSTSNLPLRGGKGWLYEGGIRVPMIVKWPGQGSRGAICNVPVISTDFYPSILEMIGVDARPNQHTDGLSFAPLLKGGRKINREAIYWHFPHYSNHGMQSPGGAIRCGKYKLIEYFEHNTIQLFNLQDDQGEQHDLAPEAQETAARLHAMLHRWQKQVSAPMMQPNPDYERPAN